MIYNHTYVGVIFMKSSCPNRVATRPHIQTRWPLALLWIRLGTITRLHYIVPDRQLHKTNRPSSFRWYGIGLQCTVLPAPFKPIHICASQTHINISSSARNGDVSILQYSFCDAWLHYVKECVPWLQREGTSLCADRH